MEKKPTRQSILEEALRLFAIQGYEGTSVAAIAQAVGITAAALYKHYTNKQDIFDAILQEMKKRYEQYARAMGMDGVAAEKDAGLLMKINEEQLMDMGTGWFLYFLHDPYASQFRKMLTIEQYRNPQLAELYVKQHFDDPLSFQQTIFELAIQAGVMRPGDPRLMALHFYAPIFLYLNLCDSQPERKTEALDRIQTHILQFHRIYRNQEETP